MNNHYKTLWAEGMLIKPQHFQQQERYFEWSIDQKIKSIQNFNYGFNHIKIDQSLLEAKKFALIECSGIFQDGMLFDLPHSGKLPEPIDIADTASNEIIYLALPIQLADSKAIAIGTQSSTNTRYYSTDQSVQDITRDHTGVSTISVAQLNTTLCLDADLNPNYTALPLAKIKFVKEDGTVILDDGFVPCISNIRASKKLLHILRELRARLDEKAKSLHQSMGQIDQKMHLGVVNDYLILKTLNAYRAKLSILSYLPVINPLDFYQILVTFYHEITSLGNNNKLPSVAEKYHHNDLRACFEETMFAIRHTLSIVNEPAAREIILTQQQNGVYNGLLSEIDIKSENSLIISVSPHTDFKNFTDIFSSQIKIGSAEIIMELINSQVTGLQIEVLTGMPSQIPYHRNTMFFRIMPKGKLWDQLTAGKNISIHLGRKFDDINLRLWSVRG